MTSPATSFHEAFVSSLPSGSRAPLLYVAAAFAIGIGLFWWLRPSASLLWSGTATIGAALLALRNKARAANLIVVVLLCFLGALRAFYDAEIPSHSIAKLLTASPQPIACEGILVSDAQWFYPAHGPARRQGWVELMHLKQDAHWIDVCGKVLARLPVSQQELRFGNRLLLHGAIRQAQGEWLWLQGASGRLTVADPQGLKVLPSRLNFWIRYRRWVTSFRSELQQLGRSLLGPEEVGYLEALLLGEKGGISRKLQEEFRKTGTIHVLVVSGLQVGLIGAMCLTILSIARVPRSLRYLLVALILPIYCTLTGASPPILRATVMGVLLCVGLIKGKEGAPLNGLGLAALLILGINPRALADCGFQLSFAAVFGLLILSPPMALVFGQGPFRPGARLDQGRDLFLWKPIAQMAGASCGAWIMVAPVVAWHFHLVSPIALVANLIVVPWASLLTVCGFLLYAVGWFSTPSAWPLAASFTALSRALSQVVELLAQVPGGSWSL